MKSKVVLNALALLFAAGAMAQDCTFFFPQTKGTQLVKKGYDAKGNLQSVMTYTVDEVKPRRAASFIIFLCNILIRLYILAFVSYYHSILSSTTPQGVTLILAPKKAPSSPHANSTNVRWNG